MQKTFVCKQCNKLFEKTVFPSRNTFDYCSPSCRNKARILTNVKCPVCGTEFAPHKINGAEKKRKQYCSFRCATQASRGKASTNPKTHSKQTTDFIKTHFSQMGSQWIADQLGFTKSAIGNLANRLGVVLNKDVYRARVHGAAQKNMLGANNPNWQGGITCKEWGDNWKQQQRKARQRDNFTCQVCGLYSKHISVHHIKRRVLFEGHMNDANELSNLICLCDKHHVPVELGKIPCPIPKE